MESDWRTTLFQLLRFLIVIVITYALFWIIKVSIPLLYPFLIGFIIALIINRPVNLLEDRGKMPRWAAVSLVLLFSITVVIGLFTLLLTQVIIEITHLITIMPVYIQEATDYVRTFIAKEIISNFYDNLQQYYFSLDQGYKTKIEENIGAALTRIAKAGTFFINAILNAVQAFLTSLPNAATVLVISVLAAFFISKDFYELKRKTASFFPALLKEKLDHIVHDLKSALVGFVRAQLTLISITGSIVIIGLLILRVEYAFTIGILTGIVDLLPLLGTGSVFVPWIIYMFIKSKYELAIGLSVLYAIVVVQRQIMEPKIVADNIGLDPLITLIALFVGLQLFGVAGLILGPVAVVILNALVSAGVFRDLWIFIRGKQV